MSDMKNITVSVPDEIYQRARVRAAEQGRSVSAVVADFLRAFSEQDEEFARLEALQREIQKEIAEFRGADRLDRQQVYQRALP